MKNPNNGPDEWKIIMFLWWAFEFLLIVAIAAVAALCVTAATGHMTMTQVIKSILNSVGV